MKTLRDRPSRREIADAFYQMHNQVNIAVSSAVQAIMDGGDVPPTVHQLQTAIDLSLREMRGKVTKLEEEKMTCS